MKKKFHLLSLCSFGISFLLFIFSYCLYHYLCPDSGHFTSIWQPVAAKPFVTELFANLGVMFLFTAILCLLISVIFFSGKGRVEK